MHEPQATRVVDRIVAQIEGDIILQSQLRELGSFQQLVEGRPVSLAPRLQQLRYFFRRFRIRISGHGRLTLSIHRPKNSPGTLQFSQPAGAISI